MAYILVVDDEESICFAFSECIKQMGHMPLAASNVADALKVIRDQTPEIVFLDNRLPGRKRFILAGKNRVHGKQAPGCDDDRLWNHGYGH